VGGYAFEPFENIFKRPGLDVKMLENVGHLR